MIKVFGLLALVCCTSCFSKRMEHLQWHHLQNSAITDFTYKVETPSKDTSLLSADTDRFRLRIFERSLDTAGFKKYVNDSQAMLQSYYKEFESPYPAALSENVVCTPALKPRPLVNITTADHLSEGVLVYANSRYTYGACDSQTLRFETLHAFIHCSKSNTAYEIKYFIPKTETSAKTLEAAYTSIKCS